MKHIRLFLLLALLATIGMAWGQNYGLYLDGNGDYVSLGNNTVNPLMAGATGITVSAWINPASLRTGTDANRNMLFDLTTNGTRSMVAMYARENGVLRFGGRSNGTEAFQNLVTPTPVLTTNTWFFVVGVLDFTNDQIRLYLDDQIIATQNVSFSSLTYTPGTGGANYFGVNAALSATQYFHGMVDEIKIWNYPLTVAQIEAEKYKEYATEASIPAGMIGYWNFNNNTNDMTSNNLDGTLFGDATYDESVTLPIELSSFTAVPNAQYFVELHWITQSETNVAGFRVYRSTTPFIQDAVMFNTFVEAHNTSETQFYTFVDEEIYASGTYYYWLENVDMSGNTDFHGPVIATVTFGDPSTPPEIPAIQSGIQKIFPNPFNPTTNIMYTMLEDAAVSVKVYNLRGQLISKLYEGNNVAGTHTVAWNGVADNGTELSSGIYTVLVKIGNKTHSQRVVLSK
ncbi:MAG TPA: T9SS type A sorting domain-containing protein [Candidatus Cloacimonadota bacterium]|nr:T9SS type A sorting domain-containing protein [Candidatus Cloacimonadota bacterium]